MEVFSYFVFYTWDFVGFLNISIGVFAPYRKHLSHPDWILPVFLLLSFLSFSCFLLSLSLSFPPSFLLLFQIRILIVHVLKLLSLSSVYLNFFLLSCFLLLLISYFWSFSPGFNLNRTFIALNVTGKSIILELHFFLSLKKYFSLKTLISVWGFKGLIWKS